MAIYGAPPYGPGTPAVVAVTKGKVRKNPFTGETNGSRKIDPQARDYVVDNATGRSEGMTNAQQLVYMAVQTEFGSSAVRALGQTLRQVKRIGPSFELDMETRLRRCVEHIVLRGIIEVVGIVVMKLRPGVGYFRLQWRDLTNVDGSVQTTDTPQFALPE